MFITEPVGEFMTFQDLFEPFRCQEREPYRDSVATQIHITNVLVDHYYKVFASLTDNISLLICDRYVHAVPVFLSALQHVGYISNFSHAVLLAYAKRLLLDVLPQADFIYYLDPPLSTIEERIEWRGRDGECGFVTRQYLETLSDEYHKQLLTDDYVWKRNKSTDAADIILKDFITFINENMSCSSQQQPLTFPPLNTKCPKPEDNDDDTSSPPSLQTAAAADSHSSDEINTDKEESSGSEGPIYKSTRNGLVLRVGTANKKNREKRRNGGRQDSELECPSKGSKAENVDDSSCSTSHPHLPKIYPRTIQYLKLDPRAQAPIRASEKAAGYDLTTIEDEIFRPGECKLVRTGLAINLPPNCYGRILDRSGVALKRMLITVGGVIDEDYTGEVKICLINHGELTQFVPRGVRLAQIVIQKYIPFDYFHEVVRFGKKTERGSAGFGSTGGSC